MFSSKKRYHYSLFRNDICDSDIVSVNKALKTEILTRGESTKNFEKLFAKYTRKKYAIAVSSGTAALHLAVKALGWKDGDKIITSPFTFVASANCLLYEKAEPVFVDINKETLNINPILVENNLDPKVKGILLPYIFGSMDDQSNYQELLKKVKLPLIEDACESLPLFSKDKSEKSLGLIQVYSFSNNKPLTCGEGGMITTNSEDIASKIKSFRDQGRILQKDWADKIDLGYNYRLTEIQSALAISQLKKLNKRLNERILLAKTYFKELKNCLDIELPPEKSLNRSWFTFYILVNDKEKRDFLYQTLNKMGIECSTNYFLPLYRFAYLKKYADTKNIKNLFPNTEEVSSKILSLPIHNKLRKSDIVIICNELKNILKKCPKSK